MTICSTSHNQLSKAIFDSLDSRNDTKEARGFFRVSETTNCGRKLYYGRTGAKTTNPFPPQVRTKMELGDVLHNWIRSKYIPENTDYEVTNWSEDKDKEDFLSYTFNDGNISVVLGGHIDGILRTWIKQGRNKRKLSAVALLEVKTTGKFGYMGTKRVGCLDPDHWSGKYVAQANDYVGLWNLNNPKEKIDQLCIFVFDTDGGKDPDTGLPHRDYWFAFDPDMFQARLQRRFDVERFLIKKETPPRFYKDSSDFECSGCLWLNKCWEGPNGRNS